MFISCGKTYYYKGVTFDYHECLGPIILNRKTWNERPFRAISSRNWSMYHKWLSLPKEEREKYRIG